MLVLYWPIDPPGRRAAPRVTAPEPVVVVRNWAALIHAARGAHCVVVTAPWLGVDCTIPRLLALRQRVVGVPVVLVTTKDAENLRHLAHCPVEEVVWIHEIDLALSSAVGRACATSFLLRLARAFAAAPGLSPVLRRALEHACRAERPIRSVTELAAAIDRHPHTLWYHWHRASGATTTLRLEDCIDWILLLRASHLRDPAHGWEGVAHRLRIHHHTLARLISRLTACTPGQLSLLAPSVVVAMADQALRPVVGQDPIRDADELASPD